MTKILFVRNLEQAAAWLELDGQISDGFWENARPNDHYKVWIDAEVRIAGPEQACGRTFIPRKDSYNFTASELLDVVGPRMLGIVRIARALGLETARELEHAVDCASGRIDFTCDYNRTRAETVGKKFLRVDTAEATRQLNAALTDESYTMKMLVKDLQDLKSIIKQYVAVEGDPR